MFLSPRFWKTDEAGRFSFLFGAIFLFFISLNTNEAPFLFILSIKMLIFGFWHMSKINKATFFIQVWKKDRWGPFETDEGGRAWETFIYLALF